MKNRISILALALGLGLAGLAQAQPSVYFLWQNKATKAKMCEPEQPGAQWEKVGGPFSDQNCSIKMPE